MLPNAEKQFFTFTFAPILESASVDSYHEHAEILEDYFGDKHVPAMEYFKKFPVDVAFSILLLNEEPQLSFWIKEEDLKVSSFLLFQKKEPGSEFLYQLPGYIQATLFPNENTYDASSQESSSLFQKVNKVYADKDEGFSETTIVRFLALVEGSRMFFRDKKPPQITDESFHGLVQSILRILEEGHSLALLIHLMENCRMENITLDFLNRKKVSSDFPTEWAEVLLQ